MAGLEEFAEKLGLAYKAMSYHLTDQPALRELREETGLEGVGSTLVDVSSSHNFFYGNLLMVTYAVDSVRGTLQARDDAMDAHYFSLEDLPVMAFTVHQRALNIYAGRR